MNNKSVLNNKIIYKKNAILELGSYLKFYHRYRNVLFLTDIYGEKTNQIVAQLAASNNSFRYCYVTKIISNNDLALLSEKSKNYDIILGFGSTRLIQLVKNLCSLNNNDCIIIPSAPTGIESFVETTISVFDSMRVLQTNLPVKIFIDEEIIKNCSHFDMLSGLQMFCAYNEFLFSNFFEKLIKNEKVDNSSLTKILCRFVDIFSQLLIDEQDAKLILMDNLIELGELLSKVPMNEVGFINLAHTLSKLSFCKEYDYSFEDYCLLSGDLLLDCYKCVLEKKNIEVFDVPDFVCMENILKKHNLVPTFQKSYFQFLESIKDNEFQLKIGQTKQTLLDTLNIIIKNYKNAVKLLTHEKKYKSASVENLEPVYESLKILPYVFPNNYLLDVVGATGLVNF